MSKKDKKKSASTASKALALGTALSLGTFGFTAIGTGAAFGAPTANTATAATNSTKVIKLANGKTRIRVDLADNLRGKTVFIRTSRMVDGKRVVVTLGRVTLNKSGQAVLTVSRKIRVEDRLVVTDGIRNIVNSKITVIDDRTPVVPVPTPTPTPAPPAGGGSSGGGSSSAPVAGSISKATTTANAATQAAVSKVDTITLSGDYEINDTITITGVATADVVVTVVDPLAVADEIVDAVNAATGATVTAAKTSGTVVTLTADVAGTAFTATVTAADGGVDASQDAVAATTTPNAAAVPDTTEDATVATSTPNAAAAPDTTEDATVATTTSNAAAQAAVAQVDTITLSGTFAVGDTITITGVASANVVVTVANASAVADEIVAAVNAAAGAAVEAAKTSATVVTLTADVAGTAFTATVAKS
jgi:hypothetical protein